MGKMDVFRKIDKIMNETAKAMHEEPESSREILVLAKSKIKALEKEEPECEIFADAALEALEEASKDVEIFYVP